MNETEFESGDVDMSRCLVGESLRHGRQLVLEDAEAGSVFWTVRPALFHDLEEGEGEKDCKIKGSWGLTS
jgi:hypothetical protein